MPFIDIHGLEAFPGDSKARHNLAEAIRSVVEKIKDLHIEGRYDTVVQFFDDMDTVPRPVRVEITLFAKEERTLSIRQELATVVGQQVKDLTTTQEVFCYINLINRDECGYWTSKKKK